MPAQMCLSPQKDLSGRQGWIKNCKDHLILLKLSLVCEKFLCHDGAFLFALFSHSHHFNILQHIRTNAPWCTHIGFAT